MTSALAVLPVRGDVGAGFVEMHMLVDMIDPGHRNEMMMLTVRRALFGQLDLVGAFQMVDLPDRFTVRRNDIHVLLDLRRIRHVRLSLDCSGTKRSRSGSVPGPPIARFSLSGDAFKGRIADRPP